MDSDHADQGIELVGSLLSAQVSEHIVSAPVTIFSVSELGRVSSSDRLFWSILGFGI